MITDHDSVTAVVTSEVCQISHIGYAGDGFFRCLDTACVDLAGFVYGIYLTVQCRSELSGRIDHTMNATRVSAASYTVHNNSTYCQLSFVALASCLALDQCCQQLRGIRIGGLFAVVHMTFCFTLCGFSCFDLL